MKMERSESRLSWAHKSPTPRLGSILSRWRSSLNLLSVQPAVRKWCSNLWQHLESPGEFLKEPQAASQTSNLNPRNWPDLQRLVLGSWDLHYRHQWKLLSCVWLFATPWTMAGQAPLSMGFSKQQYRSALPFHQWGLHWCSTCSSQITSSASSTPTCCGDNSCTQQLWCQQRQTWNSWV